MHFDITRITINPKYIGIKANLAYLRSVGCKEKCSYTTTFVLLDLINLMIVLLLLTRACFFNCFIINKSILKLISMRVLI